MWALALLVGCAQREPESTEGWWDPGTQLDVTEPLDFTTADYGIEGGIADLAADVFPTDGDGFVFAPDDDYGDARCTATTSSTLPTEITGVVTIHPRHYYKTAGCTTDDEKYYGSFFLEDDDLGVFVLGDSKVAHFTTGDVITIRVRGVRTRYDLDMVYAWDLVDVDPQGRPIKYAEQVGPFDVPDLNRVRRISGLVTTKPDTFGAFVVTGDSGQAWGASLDVELNRRGVTFAQGDRVTATGPILRSYGDNLIIQSLGQITKE